MPNPTSSIKQGICRRSLLKSVPMIAGAIISTNAVAQNFCAGEAHSRSLQISRPSKQRAAMLRLRPVRGPGFMQGCGGSGRRERLVSTLHGEARLGIRLHSREIFSGLQRLLAGLGMEPVPVSMAQRGRASRADECPL